MYVTLEPCTHFGFTPPCTNIIKKKKIKNVYYSFNDPDKRTHLKAKKVLKKIFKLKKIENKFTNFYKSYFLNKIEKFPLIDAKLALSKDYLTINKKSKWITNFRSRKVAQLIRSKYDCILSTSKSINKDNSLLNCRIDGLDNSKPDLVIIDRNLNIKKKLKLFDLSHKRKIIIISSSNNKKKISFLRKKKVRVIKVKRLENKQDFYEIFRILFKLGIGRIIVETGLVFLNKLFEFKLVNNLYLFKSNIILKNKGYNNSSVSYIKKLKLNKKINVNLNNDELFNVRMK